MSKIAFIGSGAAGASIINSLRKADNDVIVGIRDQSKFAGATTIEDAIKKEI